MFKFIKEELKEIKNSIKELKLRIKPEYDKTDEIARGIDRIDNVNRQVQLLTEFFEVKDRIHHVKDEQRKMKKDINVVKSEIEEIHSKLDKVIELLSECEKGDK